MDYIYIQRGRGLKDKLFNLITDQKVFYELYDLLENYLHNSHRFSFVVFGGEVAWMHFSVKYMCGS